MILRFSLILNLLALPLAGFSAPADESGGSFFERRIRPILIERCYECHSEEAGEQKGGLLLDRASGWLEGGDNGKAVVPGDLAGSLLVTAIRYEDEDFQMPPKTELPENERKLLEQWIRRGAPSPGDDMGDTEFSRLGDQEWIFEQAASHWAFKPVDAVAPPKIDDPEWAKNPIDAFIFAGLAEAGLKPSPPADERTLSRRLSYDLTGLPPGTEPNSIQQLLESPAFGEHFARMWLDVARYADTANTYRPDTKTPHYYPYAFTYRDYVIAAYNEDKPFDVFVREQLAADLMGLAKDASELAALGFLGVSPHRAQSSDFIDDAIDTTTRGFLGLTAACSRCHDHKFEPIPTADYYSLVGVFGSIQRPAPWDLEKHPTISGYTTSPEVVADYDSKRTEIDKKIKEAGNKKKGGNNRSVADTIKQTELAFLLTTHDGGPVQAIGIFEGKKPIQSAILIRGDAANRGEIVPRRFLKILDSEQEPFPEESSGRLELADKIADPENPLTARVYVNRVWGALMGGYLVDTPSVFGLEGAEPTNQQLLDWLAADFVSNGWSTKHLVDQIVTSRTYQQSSAHRADAAAIDTENKLLWRANRKRLTIEELRDSLLFVSGQLDTRMRGRSGDLWGEEATRRRSIYGFINGFNLDPTLRNFDFPTPGQTIAKRTENIVPTQALFTMNSRFAVARSKALTQDLEFEDKNRVQRIDALFQRVLGRMPDLSERGQISQFMDQPEIGAWPLVVQSLFMSNEFLYVD
jgi:hypothetical protein